MTDYKNRTQKSILKKISLFLINIPIVNKILVPIIKIHPNIELKTRIPVYTPYTKLIIGNNEDIILKNTEKCQVAKDAFWTNGHLKSKSEEIALSSAVILSKNSDVFLDIGAYTGLFSLAVARLNPGTEVYSFEILPENFRCLWDNVFVNDLVDRIHPKIVGIGETPGFLKAPITFGQGVLPSSVAIDSNTYDGISIPIDSIDRMFPDFNGKMTWKIDVEGFEWQILNGGKKIIKDIQPDIISEVLVRAPNISEIEGFLKSLDYNMFHITNLGLNEKNTLQPSKTERDWLFTPKSREDLLALGVQVL